MGAVQIGILADHLGFHPQTELQPEVMNIPCQLLKGAAELLLVYGPVAEAGGIVVPLAEPSVVQHQHIHAQFLRFPGKVQQAFRVKIKIGRFPAVEQDRFPCLPPPRMNDFLPDNPVIVPAQAVQAVPAVGEDRFRGLEAFSRLPGTAV